MTGRTYSTGAGAPAASWPSLQEPQTSQEPTITDVLDDGSLVHLFASMSLDDVTVAAKTCRGFRAAAEIMIMQTGILREYTDIFGIPEIQFASPTPQQDRPVVPAEKRKLVLKELSRLNKALGEEDRLKKLGKKLPLHPLPILGFLKTVYDIQLVYLFQTPAKIRGDRLRDQVQQVRSWLNSEKARSHPVIFGNDLNLTALPKEIVQCTALQVLPLEGNRIKNLTARIDTLPHLQRISLAKNDFETVPPILLNCKALRQVDLRYNQIHLPLASPVPEFFDLTGNPPLKPPTGSTSSSGRCQIQ